MSEEDYGSTDHCLHWCVRKSDKDTFDVLYDRAKSSISKSDINEVLIECAATVNGYTASHTNECNNYQIFQILLKHPKIDVNYQSLARRNETVLTALIKHKKTESKRIYVEYLFDTFKDKIDLSIHNKAPSKSDFVDVNLLLQSDSYNDETIVELLQTHFPKAFNLNAQFNFKHYKQDTLLTKKAKFASKETLQYFRLLLKTDENLDWQIKNADGLDVVDILLIKLVGIRNDESKKEYIEAHLQSLINSQKLTYEMIEKRKKLFSAANKLGNMAYNSDYHGLQEALKLSNNNNNDILVGIPAEIDGNIGTAIEMCCLTNRKYISNCQNCGNFDCFKLLINNKTVITSLNKKDGNGGFLLLRSLLKKHKYEFVKYLIENREKLAINLSSSTSTNNSGDIDINPPSSCLMNACYTSKGDEMVKLLLDCNIFDANYTNKSGTVLHIFASQGNTKNGYDKEYPMQCRYFKILEMLLKHNKTNPNIKDYKGDTVLALLIKRNHFEYLEYIIKQNGKYSWKLDDITQFRNIYNQSLLYIAVRYGRYRCLKFLLELNVFKDINILGGTQNDSLLNVCISTNLGYDMNSYKECTNYKCFMLLLKQDSIDPTLENKRKQNAFDMCYRSGKIQYLSHLELLKKKKEN